MPEVSQTPKRFILCGGMQSGGTTLVSWCFLQRRDTNGALDVPADLIQPDLERVKEPIVWVKMTVASFRWLEVSETYQDLGWKPEPFLVVRDVRAASSSLLRKQYGFNGTTSEQPPLRLRLRRFLRDWEMFRTNGWPILKYEDLVEQGAEALKRACSLLSLKWDEGMVTWPRSLEQIEYVHNLQETFRASIGKGDLNAALLRDRSSLRIENLPLSELDWLEETFREYNAFHGYPARVEHPAPDRVSEAMPPPSFKDTVREWFIQENQRLWDENVALRTELDRLRQRGESDRDSVAA